jgi:phage anti-repressor protein
VREHIIGGRTVLAVLSKDLHEALGVGTRYVDWFDEQAVHCKLIAGIEFVKGVFPKTRKNSAVRSPKERIVEFQAAKRIGMLIKSERGDRIRLYFLNREYRMLNNLGPPDPIARRVEHEAQLPAAERTGKPAHR